MEQTVRIVSVGELKVGTFTTRQGEQKLLVKGEFIISNGFDEIACEMLGDKAKPPAPPGGGVASKTREVSDVCYRLCSTVRTCATSHNSLYHSSPKRRTSGPCRKRYTGRPSWRPFSTAGLHTLQRS